MPYLYLPSNASMDFYPNNTLQNYRTRVNLTDEFNGNWEVGLVNIIYPGISYNINASDAKMFIQMTNRHTRGVSIPVGRYTTIQQLVTSINKALNSVLPPSALQHFLLKHEDLTGKVTYSLVDNPKKTDIPDTVEIVGDFTNARPTDEYAYPLEPVSFDLAALSYNTISGSSFSQRVSDILGFEDTLDRAKFSSEFFMQHREPTFTGRYVADLNRGQEPMFVYSDIMEPCPVGDTRAPLLRIIPHREDYSSSASLCYKSFTRIHYHPVKRKTINEIEIDIKDGYGKPIPFDRGTLTVTLHLRRAKSHF